MQSGFHLSPEITVIGKKYFAEEFLVENVKIGSISAIALQAVVLLCFSSRSVTVSARAETTFTEKNENSWQIYWLVARLFSTHHQAECEKRCCLTQYQPHTGHTYSLLTMMKRTGKPESASRGKITRDGGQFKL